MPDPIIRLSPAAVMPPGADYCGRRHYCDGSGWFDAECYRAAGHTGRHAETDATGGVHAVWGDAVDDDNPCVIRGES